MGLPVIGVSITIGLNVIFGFVGARLALYQKKDILRVTTMLRRERTEVSTKVPSPGELPTSRTTEQRGNYSIQVSLSMGVSQIFVQPDFWKDL